MALSASFGSESRPFEKCLNIKSAPTSTLLPICSFTKAPAPKYAIKGELSQLLPGLFIGSYLPGLYVAPKASRYPAERFFLLSNDLSNEPNTEYRSGNLLWSENLKSLVLA